MAAPSYVNHGTGVTTGTSVTVTKPASTADGHLMLVHIQHSTGNLGADGTAPSGWTLIGTRQENASSSHWYYWKIASSEGASWDWTNYASATLQYGIVIVSGADQTTPLNVTHLLQNTNIGGTTVALSVITTVADCLLVGFAGQDQTVSTNTWSQASMTERYDENQTSDLTHCGYTETVTTATTYNRTITASVAQRISGALIGVAPAGGDVTASPAVTAAPVAAPQATPSVSDEAAPAVIASTVSAPQATPSVSDTGAPAATTTVVALPQATISADATVTPVAIAAAVTLPSSARNIGAGPGVLAAVAALPQATPQAGGNATVMPIQIVTAAAMPQAVPVGAAAVSPAMIVAFVAAPTAIPTVHDVAAPGVLTVVSGLPQSSIVNGAEVAPAAITALSTLLPPGESISAGPAQIASVVTLPLSAAIDEGAQVNGTSTPTITGPQSTTRISGTAPAATITQRGSSTSAVSDG